MNRFEEGWVVIRSTLKFKLVLIFFNFPLSVYRDLLLKEIILVQKWPIPLSLLNSKKWNKNDFLFKFSDVHLFYATLQWFGQRLNQNLHVKVWRWRNWNIDVYVHRNVLWKLQNEEILILNHQNFLKLWSYYMLIKQKEGKWSKL